MYSSYFTSQFAQRGVVITKLIIFESNTVWKYGSSWSKSFFRSFIEFLGLSGSLNEMRQVSSAILLSLFWTLTASLRCLISFNTLASTSMTRCRIKCFFQLAYQPKLSNCLQFAPAIDSFIYYILDAYFSCIHCCPTSMDKFYSPAERAPSPYN